MRKTAAALTSILLCAALLAACGDSGSGSSSTKTATVPDGKLASNSAQVTFRGNQIVRAIIKGSPASFEQKLKDKDQIARGKAETIDYDVQASTVKLVGQAWLTDGQNEARSSTLIYDIGQQRVVANPDEKDPGGVHFTIVPKSQTATPKKESSQ